MSHEHRWFECFRQSDPPARVMDCACGARRRVYPGMCQPEIEDVAPNAGGSINNCLVYLDGMTPVSGLGDPQADRLRMLVASTQGEN